MSDKSFCDVFKELRLEKNNMSQDAIAKELDVSPALISKWENNQSTPAPEMLEYIADYFDVSVDYLIGRTNDKRWYSSTKQDMEIINLVYDTLKLMPRNEQLFILMFLRNFLVHYLHKDDDLENEYINLLNFIENENNKIKSLVNKNKSD